MHESKLFVLLGALRRVHLGGAALGRLAVGIVVGLVQQAQKAHQLAQARNQRMFEQLWLLSVAGTNGPRAGKTTQRQL